MKQPISRKFWPIAAIAVVLALAAGTVLAHEGRDVGDYRFVVGWVEEPAYEGMTNGVEVKVTKPVEATGHDDEGDDGHEEDGDDRSILPSAASKVLASGLPQSGSNDHAEEPVLGLQDTLQVEVTYAASGVSKVLNLRAVLDQPGYYTAGLIPTAPGQYQFRVFGAVEGYPVDEIFVSRGGGGDFDDVQTTSALQFPDRMTGPREIESAVRGAVDTPQRAEDAALAAGDNRNVLGIIGIVMGGVGLAAGTSGLVVALRKRGPTPK